MNKIEFDRDSYLKLKEIYVNIKNYDFDVLGNYHLTENEGKKFIEGFEKFFSEGDGTNVY